MFFGGRYSEFAQFVDDLYRTCSNVQPILIGDDSVNRYMANTAARASAPPSLSMAYVSKGSLAFCGNLVKATDVERQYFLEDVRAVYQRCKKDTMTPVGERVGLAYDAVLLLVHTTQELTDKSPQGLYKRISSNTDPEIGVTGPLKFKAGVAQDKHLALLCVRDILHAFQPGSPVPERVFETGSRHQTDAPASGQPCAQRL